MTPEEFEKLVTEGIDALPQSVHEKIKNVAVVVEPYPTAETLREQKLRHGSTLLGLYRGIPRSARDTSYGIGATMPDVITIYREPILALSGGDPNRIREMVIETVWHEFGHYMGLNEAEVRAREKERKHGKL